MEEYKLEDIIEVHNKDYNGFCCEISIKNKLNPRQRDFIECFISEEEKDYILQYGEQAPITELFKVGYDFYKKKFRLKFNQSLLK